MNSKKYPQLNKKRWLEQQLHQKSRIQVARELGCHRSHVEKMAKRYGITYVKEWQRACPPLPKIQFPKLQDIEWLKNELRTKSKLQIAEEIGCTYSAVTYMANKHGIVVGRGGIRRKSKTRGENVSKGIRRAYPHGRLGSLAANWQGGISNETQRPRSEKKNKEWHKAVFERDNYTCVWCGKRGGYLEADHIKSWADYPELRFDINNGRTLCRPCHILTFKKSNPDLSTPLPT